MKLAAGDIPGFLGAPPPQLRGVLLYGPDGGLIRERAEGLARKIVADPSDPFNTVELSEAALLEDEALLADELAAMSLMGGRRLIRLRDAGDKSASIIASALAHAAGSDSVLLVLAEELGPRSGLRALFEKETVLAALPCYKDEGRALESLIRGTLSARSIAFDADVLRYLTDHLGSDRGITMSELEKIMLYLGGEKRLTLSAVRQLVGASDDLTLDDLAQAVADGDLPALDEALPRLLAEGVAPVALLRGLVRYFQRLYALCGQMEDGASLERAIQQLRPPVFFRDVPVLKRQAPHWPRPRVTRALDLLLKAERDIKSGSMAPELVTGRVVLRLAQKQSAA
jgi:DNA polymerase III subunit delta